MSDGASTVADQIAAECVMTRWRMTNRILAAVYDEEFRPFGLKSSQLGLLVAVTKAGPVRRIDLGRHLSLDPSTVTRNLQVNLKHGRNEEGPPASGKDRASLAARAG